MRHSRTRRINRLSNQLDSIINALKEQEQEKGLSFIQAYYIKPIEVDPYRFKLEMKASKIFRQLTHIS